MNETLIDRVSVTEAAAICGVTVKTIYVWIKKGDGFPIPDEHGRMNQLDVLEWASKRAMRTAKLVR